MLVSKDGNTILYQNGILEMRDVGIYKVPNQSKDVGKQTKVIFNYDSTQKHEGVIIRDDIEEPFLTLIKLDAGPFIISTECQYSVPI